MTEEEVSRRYMAAGRYLNNQTEEGWAELVRFVQDEVDRAPGGGARDAYYYDYSDIEDRASGTGTMGPFWTPEARQADLQSWELDANDTGTGPMQFDCYRVDAQGVRHAEASWRAG